MAYSKKATPRNTTEQKMMKTKTPRNTGSMMKTATPRKTSSTVKKTQTTSKLKY